MYGHAIEIGPGASIDREAWLDARGTGIGASESASVLGLGWSSPWTVAAEKRGMLTEWEGNAATSRGHALEPWVAERFAARGWQLEYPVPVVLAHPVHRCIVASLDAWLPVEQMPVEIKTAKPWLARALKAWRNEGTLPPQGTAERRTIVGYIIQVHHQMLVTGAQGGQAVVYILGDDEPTDVYVPRDKDIIDLLTQAIPSFWARFVEGDSMPPIDQPVPVERMRRPEDATHESECPELAELLTEYAAAQDKIKSLYRTSDTLRGRIADRMRELAVTKIRHTAATISWREGSSRIDTRRLKAEHPELCKQYITKGAASVSIWRKRK
jgi:putative phage-type endonuclease